MYFTTDGPTHGPFRWTAAIAPIIVLEAPDRPWPVGKAAPIAQAADGTALWRLTVGGAELPGLWTVVDREFHPAE